MGDPKFARRKFDTPSHPWEGERIEAENELLKKYGLKNKREVWKGRSTLRHFRQRARVLQGQIRYKDAQAEREVKELIDSLLRLGLLKPEQATLDDVLAMSLDDILSRRLQTITYIKGYTRTPNQARQFITHGHISIGDRKVTIPGYLVPKEDEEKVIYNPRSPIANDLHPARPRDDNAPPLAPREAPSAEPAAPQPEPQPAAPAAQPEIKEAAK